VVLALVPRPELAPVGHAELAAAQRLASAGFSARQSVAANRPSAWDSPTEVRVPGRFVVGFETGCSDAAGSWVLAQGGSVVRIDAAGGFVVADFPRNGDSVPGGLDRSAAQSGFNYFEPVLMARAAGLPNDPFFIPYQWDKWVMYADQAWDATGGSNQVRVAVVDNGCDYSHPDLASEFTPGDLGYDFVDNDNDPRPQDTAVGESFHGTHVAGIIAATRNNGIGIAGWAQCQLLAVRVLNDSGSGTTDVVASGVRWAVDHGARVINMSLTSSANSTPLDQACEYARQNNVVVVAASGNDGASTVGFPAALGPCIAVGAESDASLLASFSNYGPEQELVAPGTAILSCRPGRDYTFADGTSMASPQVAGVAALLLARNWGLSAVEVRAILDASAVDMGSPGQDTKYGYGLVNAKRAVDLAAIYGSRMAQMASTASAGTHERTVIMRAGSDLPAWLIPASVYDRSGRLVRSGGTTRPGTYFVRRPGAEVCRLLVLD
jgi:subtilisin family serine protease